MIILEGPDGAGKSTLATQIEEFLGITREPRAVTASAEKLKPIGQFVDDELRRGFGVRLYDRFALLSSPMYISLPNPTFSEELLNFDFLQMAWRKLIKVNPLVIMCLPPYEVVRENILKDMSSQVVWPHIDAIYWSYHNMFAMLKAHGMGMIYDYTLTGEAAMTQQIALENSLRWVQAQYTRNQEGKQ